MFLPFFFLILNWVCSLLLSIFHQLIGRISVPPKPCSCSCDSVTLERSDTVQESSSCLRGVCLVEQEHGCYVLSSIFPPETTGTGFSTAEKKQKRCVRPSALGFCSLVDFSVSQFLSGASPFSQDSSKTWLGCSCTWQLNLPKEKKSSSFSWYRSEQDQTTRGKKALGSEQSDVSLSLGTHSAAWNIIPCSVPELVQFLVLILLFPVSAKGEMFTGCSTRGVLGELLPVIPELSDPGHFALCLHLCN